MGLFAVQGFGVIAHFFTGTIPALLTWFGKNWSDVFFTVFDLATTVFINLGENIRNIMSGIWDFIASGGTKSLKLAWKPLTEGFVNTVKEIPDIPKRAIGSLEKQLQADVASLGDNLGGSLANEIATNLEMLDKFKLPTAEISTDLGTTPDKIEEDGAPGGGSSDQNQPLAPEALQRGSVAAFEKIMQHRNKGEDAKTKLQKEGNKQRSKVLKETEDVAVAIREVTAPSGGGGGFLAGWESA